MESYPLAHKADLYVLDCSQCGVVFGVPSTMEKRRRSDGRTFWCPNGHTMSWHTTEEDRLRKRAEKAERIVTRERAAADRAAAEAKHMAAVARGHKGAHQRTKNRVARGVCPCCRRSFVDLERHMAGQHPDYGGES